MRTTTLTFRQHCLSVVFLIAGAVTTAFAVPPAQVLKVTTPLPPLVGPCCFSFNETVAVTEPAKPVPVVVTWSATTGFTTTTDEFVGLMVNGGPCRFYGSGSIATPGVNTLTNSTFEWIVFPGDGLSAGTNTFTLCGGAGGIFKDDPFNVFMNTLAVRISN